MADVFQSCRLTLLRAQHHIDDLNAKINEFVSSQPWSMVVKPDLQARENVVKVKFARRLPTDLPCILFDAANNLRAALDQAGYASTIASGKVEPKKTNFPFADISSPRQAFLSRPRTTDPIPAASQLVSIWSVGGPPARARAFCPRGDALSGRCSPREPSAGCSSRATSGADP
jgi:hypothetical protein